MMLVAIRAGLLNQLQSIGARSPRRFNRLCESVPLKRACIDWSGHLPGCRLNENYPETAKRRSRKYPFDTGMARPVVTRAAEKKNGTGSSALSAPFCPRVFLLSAHPSERWMVGAVGIEPTTFGLKGRCSTTELRPYGVNFLL